MVFVFTRAEGAYLQCLLSKMCAREFLQNDFKRIKRLLRSCLVKHLVFQLGGFADWEKN